MAALGMAGTVGTQGPAGDGVSGGIGAGRGCRRHQGPVGV